MGAVTQMEMRNESRVNTKSQKRPDTSERSIRFTKLPPGRWKVCIPEAAGQVVQSKI